jgi:hypothetical protein
MANSPHQRLFRFQATRFAGQLVTVAVTALAALCGVASHAAGFQSKLLVTATVVDSCSLNLSQAQLFPQRHRLVESSRAFSCDGHRPAAAAPTPSSTLQIPLGAAIAEVASRGSRSLGGLYNVDVDEGVGQITLTF